MWDVLSALIPPVVVATVFCVAVYTLLRKEMAPRTSDGRPVEESESVTRGTPDGKAAADADANKAQSASEEVHGAGEEAGGR
ncbi:hypothetical protein AC529_17035 [Thermobifida cellulosilytica TB100]|uniref:Uncharacterized protein n=1 Tax=Thermobifida cellulosilytica TB100 TaxID=665004 RepID=A0A147KE43_THECS|nr:hypothetical protein [Thermobifida cellulosilytica]KUP95538.1 hypothetical protein AC529_17035 [Thermobifida cellulosilytica TB100]